MTGKPAVNAALDKTFVPSVQIAPPEVREPLRLTKFGAVILPVAVTVVGVIAPRVRVMAGVEVGVATEPETPFAVTTDTLVTVPAPEGV